MKYSFLFLGLLLGISSDVISISTQTTSPIELAQTSRSNPLDSLDSLIISSQQTIEIAKEIRRDIQKYLSIQEDFIQNAEDRQLCFRMVKEAYMLLNKIKKHNLTQAIDPEFLNELTYFSQIGSKKGVPLSSS